VEKETPIHPLFTDGVAIFNAPTPEALLNARQAVKDDDTLYRIVFLQCAELVKISQANETKGVDRNVFVKDDEVEATKRIGLELYSKGDLYEITISSVSDNAKEVHLQLGLGCMMLAHEIARRMFKEDVDARLLEFAWNGIGGWQS
tara:strand:+ start:125 stop:562 length:438 start_codon:yes stop_codon:yes gene_type:complete